ncbi:MAG: apolipoprotein N-acyltransferase [Bdellovibrionaceae bacterium]|nr:apolipoprotein N-acyltransferase [Pseudobdellovibrionaceae bacterium]
MSSVLIATTYVPFPPWALLFCFVPLWLWLNEPQRTGRGAFFGGWLTQFIFTLIGNHWIAHTAKEFGYFPWPLAILTLLLFAAFIHLHVPMASYLSVVLRNRLNLRGARFFFVLALVFSLVERIWPMIFPYNMGYTLLWAQWPVYQWADVIGFSGLSSVIFLINAWIAWMWTRRHDTRRVLKHAGTLAFLLGGFTLGGLWHARSWKHTDAEVKALVVQANIGNLEKAYAEQGRGFLFGITSKFVELTQKGLGEHPDADLVVWPETAFPDSPDRPEFSQPRLDQIAAGLGPLEKPLLIGAYSKDPSPTGRARDALTYNAVFLLDSRGKPLDQPYRKTDLLMFGEYLPLSETFPILLEWLPFISNFGRGQGPMTLNWRRAGGEVRLGPQICYEGLFPDFSRGLALKGAEVLVNVTNDSWFGTPFEPRQHMNKTLARAIEVRRPLVRSTNTGISTAILADGTQLQRSPSDQEWTGLYRIPYKQNPPLTFYTRYGHWDWLLLCLALLLLLTMRGKKEDHA